MSSPRAYELGVLGATGYTGERIVRYLAQLHSAGLYTQPILLAGRSLSRLQAVLSRLPPSPSPHPFHLLPDISTTSPTSLLAFTRQVSVVINAAGPYRFHGPPTLTACLSSSTHYTDVTGEPEFIERSITQHDRTARDRRVRITHACGFDSMPADLGTLQCVREAQSGRFGADAALARVDAVVTLHSGAHGVGLAYGTWASLVHGLANRTSLAAVRRQLKAKYDGDGPTTIRRIGPTPHLPFTHYDDALRKHRVVFPGSDATVVRNTQTQLVTRGYDAVLPWFTVTFTVAQRWWVWLLMAWSALLYLLASVKLMQGVLLRYPRLFTAGYFSEAGPTQAQLDGTSLTFDFFASGYRQPPSPPPSPSIPTTSALLPPPDVRLHLRLRMKEPGYVATPIFVVQAALVLVDAAKGKQVVPVGVMTPGTAFKDTDLVERLAKEGMSFEVVEDGVALR